MHWSFTRLSKTYHSLITSPLSHLRKQSSHLTQQTMASMITSTYSISFDHRHFITFFSWYLNYHTLLKHQHNTKPRQSVLLYATISWFYPCFIDYFIVSFKILLKKVSFIGLILNYSVQKRFQSFWRLFFFSFQIRYFIESYFQMTISAMINIERVRVDNLND